MLLGQSVFQSVVERLKLEAEDNPPEETTADSYKVKGFNSSFVLDSATQDVSATNIHAEAYLDFLPEPPPPEIPEPMPAYLERTSLADVSDELAIGDNDTVLSLGEKRRNFARLNHPDMVHPDFRTNANLRMTAANLLIDQAIRFLEQ